MIIKKFIKVLPSEILEVSNFPFLYQTMTTPMEVDSDFSSYPASDIESKFYRAQTTVAISFYKPISKCF